ncbi:MAG TPA: hypothetical protein VJZ27_15940, partial [Aggregatilineales bacterium]|nr:hypothetical protein [Aggregatilineales bacterium]
MILILLIVFAGCGRIAESDIAPDEHLVLNHPYRVTLTLPDDWILQPGTIDTYGNQNASLTLKGLPLESPGIGAACAEYAFDTVNQSRSGSYPEMEIEDDYCVIRGDEGITSVLLRYPEPLISQLGWQTSTYLEITTNADDWPRIIENVDFTSVPPLNLYMAGLVDAIAANSLYPLDWDAMRHDTQSMLANGAEVYPVMDMILGRLREAGDQHTALEVPTVAQLTRQGRVMDTGYHLWGDVVVIVYPASPASRAGLRQGDIITRAGVEPGSGRVFLGVQHDEDSEPFDLEFTMDAYDSYLPPNGAVIGGNIGYIELFSLRG